MCATKYSFVHDVCHPVFICSWWCHWCVPPRIHLFMMCATQYSFVHDVCHPVFIHSWCVPPSIHSFMMCATQYSFIHDVCHPVFIHSWCVPPSIHSFMMCATQYSFVYDACHPVFIRSWCVPPSIHSFMMCATQYSFVHDVCQPVSIRSCDLHHPVFALNTHSISRFSNPSKLFGSRIDIRFLLRNLQMKQTDVDASINFRTINWHIMQMENIIILYISFTLFVFTRDLHTWSSHISSHIFDCRSLYWLFRGYFLLYCCHYLILLYRASVVLWLTVSPPRRETPGSIPTSAKKIYDIYGAIWGKILGLAAIFAASWFSCMIVPEPIV